MPNDRAEAMRLRLASVGIVLDDPAPAARAAAARAPAAEVDREAVRRILVERGARDRDLDWLTASCPSEELARAYTVPRLPDPRPVRRAYPRKEPPAEQAAERHNVTVHSEEKERTET